MLDGLSQSLKNIFYPPLCFSCEAKTSGSYLCGQCKENIEFFWPPLCRICGIPFCADNTTVCPACREKEMFYNRLISIAAYQGPVKTLVLHFKYQRCDYLADFLADLMAGHMFDAKLLPYAYDLMTCVPMHPTRLKERGYNQAHLLGKNLAAKFNLEFAPDLIRVTKNRPAQVTLSQAQRRQNIQDAFASDYDLAGKNIVMIDDIFTTGATINACAYALKAAKAQTVLALTLAKTL